MSVCPLCGQEIKKSKVVYGHTICKNCWAGYINRRQVAYVIDGLILTVAAFFGGMALASVFGAEMGWGVFFLTLVLDGLWLGRDALGGRSPGKACMNMETIDNSSGAPIGWQQAFVRNWPLAIGVAGILVTQFAEMITENQGLALIAQIPVAVIVIAMAFQINRGPRWGDAQANTRVIWRRYGESPVFNPAIASSFAAPPEFAPAMLGGAAESSNDPYRAPRT
jgi:hypothetical protein